MTFDNRDATHPASRDQADPRTAAGTEPDGVAGTDLDGAPEPGASYRAPGLGVRLAAEAAGTFVVVLAGVGAALYGNLWQLGHLGIALAFGLGLAVSTAAFGRLSGGHFNPAVTLGAVVAGRRPWRDLLPYWVAQVLGGLVAAALLFVTVPPGLPALASQDGSLRTFFASVTNGYGTHSPLWTASSQQVQLGLWPQGFVLEAVAAAVLVGVTLAVTGRRAGSFPAPAVVGAAYTLVVLVTLPLTNGAVNPARATATAVLTGGWAISQLWAFWVAPLVGALLAAVVHLGFTTPPAVDDDDLDDDLEAPDDGGPAPDSPTASQGPRQD